MLHHLSHPVTPVPPHRFSKALLFFKSKSQQNCTLEHPLRLSFVTVTKTTTTQCTCTYFKICNASAGDGDLPQVMEKTNKLCSYPHNNIWMRTVHVQAADVGGVTPVRVEQQSSLGEHLQSSRFLKTPWWSLQITILKNFLFLFYITIALTHWRLAGAYAPAL